MSDVTNTIDSGYVNGSVPRWRVRLVWPSANLCRAMRVGRIFADTFLRLHVRLLSNSHTILQLVKTLPLSLNNRLILLF